MSRASAAVEFCSTLASSADEVEASPAEVIERMFDLEGCEGYKPGGICDLLVKSAINEARTHDVTMAVCQAVNGDARTTCATGFCVGHLVAPGGIGIIDHNGRIEAVPGGRYVLGFARARWVTSCSLDMLQPLQCGALTIVRVPRGQIGLAKFAGNAILLDAGLHVYNDVRFYFERCVDVSTEHVHHGPLHVLRVTRGEYVKAWALGPSGAVEPRLLREGYYVVDSNLFSVDSRCSVSDEHVSHGALHVLQVPKGKVAKVTKDNVPSLLGEGCHNISSTNFQYAGRASLSDQVISHGTITSVRVNRGQVGLAWQDNQPTFLQEPGLYNFDSPTFIFVRHADISEKMIELGAKKIVTVYSGEVGLSYEHGELHILQPGRHIIEDSAHTVDGFLSTQQRSVRLVSPDQAKRPGTDLLVCETRDLIKVGIRADVFYAIKDPEKAIRNMAKGDVEKLIVETSLSTVNNIMRSTALNEIAQSKLPSAVSAEQREEQLKTAQALADAPSAPLFFDRAHDEFLSKLHDDFSGRYGIEITNIRIESFKIMDNELANTISRQAVVTAQTENSVANLAGQTEIATKEQERLASVRQIGAQAEAQALRTKAEGENAALLSSAEAQARALQVSTEAQARAEAAAIIERAKAEAEAIRMRGEAEAEAFAKKADAEAKRARLLAETPLGAQLSLLGLYSEMAAKSNEGVQKVVYSDLQSNNAGLLGLPSLQGFGRDLGLLLQPLGSDGGSAPSPGGQASGHGR